MLNSTGKHCRLTQGEKEIKVTPRKGMGCHSGALVLLLITGSDKRTVGITLRTEMTG